ncbi:MAG: YedE family putative selenium transporter [Planctomycetota bacterium]
MTKIKLAYMVLLAGAVFGLLFALLIKAGNPANMGVCVACFTRDIAGALRLHRVDAVSYLRPEILGFILGSCAIALATREFRATGGSAPLLRFILGGFMMIGALAFLGCPNRMIGRLAGGDWTALAGLLGFAAGIFIGTLGLRRGFSLGRARPQGRAAGMVLPILAAVLVAALLVKPAFIFFAEKGHAAWYLSIGAGLLIGILGQRARLCFAGGFRDLFIMGDTHLFQGILAFGLAILITNLALGQFHAGATPIAHSAHLAGFLGMALVGLCAVLLGGCPFRQTIMAGNGSGDAGLAVLGMIAGAACAHNFLLAAKPDAVTEAGVRTVGGISGAGYTAVIAGLVICLVVGFTSRTAE